MSCRAAVAVALRQIIEVLADFRMRNVGLAAAVAARQRIEIRSPVGIYGIGVMQIRFVQRFQVGGVAAREQ